MLVFKKIFPLLLFTMIINSFFVAQGKQTNWTEGFGISIATDRAIYSIEEPVTITLTIFNYTKDTLTFSFASSQRYDFVIEKEEKVIWRWSSGRVFAQVMGKEVVKPGESLVYKEVYRPQKKLTPGIYTVTGMLTCREPLKIKGTVCIQIGNKIF